MDSLFDDGPDRGGFRAPGARGGWKASGTGGAEPVRLCVLGSGSGGNSAVVQIGRNALLIDAGFGPVTTARRLNQAGLGLADVRGIVLTHLDRDHFRENWNRTLLGWKIPVYCHKWHLEQMRRREHGAALIEAGLVRTFGDAPFEPMGGAEVTSVALRHDAKGTFAFHVQSSNGCRIGYATDLGHVPEELIERFAGVGLLAIESNYDPPMQLGSGRPLFLQRRIMGGAGHLSNEQAFEAVRRIDRVSAGQDPRHIVLLHRSQQCNSAACVRAMFGRDPGLMSRVSLTEQRRRSRWFPVAASAPPGHKQLSLAF